MIQPRIIEAKHWSNDTFGSFAVAGVTSLDIASTGGAVAAPVAPGLGSHPSSLYAKAVCTRKSYRKNQSMGSIGSIQFVFRTHNNEEELLPKTALGKKLMALRTRAIGKGMVLLSQDGVEEEIASIRGEQDFV